jgi:hypothetical protein
MRKMDGRGFRMRIEKSEGIRAPEVRSKISNYKSQIQLDYNSGS